ncbi:MAG: DUF420 domain-containing protein [Rhodospirillales bacterium]|nr:DUF420 domain-containing protein [Rhodospirillales bacterium]
MGFEVGDLTHVIAGLNATSVLCLIAGFVLIRRGERAGHRAAMLGALALSAAFMVVYVYYKANSGFARFGGEGIIRSIYFTILSLHVLGAIAIVPLVPLTVLRAFQGRFAKHRKLARRTWPLWIAVGVSGVIVYVMAVHLYPYGGG